MKHNTNHTYEQDDATLVTCVLAGEREAFDLLLRRYSSSVLRLCHRLLGNPIEAQDILQETALQAFLGLSHLRNPARFGAWFHAIAANLARSALRRRQERPLSQLGEEAGMHLLWSEAPATIEDAQREQEIRETILQALHELAPAMRAAMVGFYLHGYHYEELAQRLSVPVSTLKWRLFTGRKQLKTRLQPLAETLLSPVERSYRKERSMKTGDLVRLRIDSLRSLRFTRQFLVILRDPDSSRGLPVSLTQAEFSALDLAVRARKDAPELSLPQDLGARLLESLEARLEQVVINALAGQTLYATATIRQEGRLRELDMRFSEALILAVRADAPLSIERSLFETAATLDLTRPLGPLSEEGGLAREKELQKPGREEHLLWEEAERQRATTLWRKRSEQPWERLWSLLLVSLTGSSEALSAAELRALDPATTFPTREVTWDAQPMIAIQLPAKLEPGWLLIPHALWETITRQWQALCEGQHERDAAPLAASSVAEVLTPPQHHQAEELVAQLVELPDVRSAFLLTPSGRVAVWKGPDSPDARNDLLEYAFLANESELRRQFGHQWQETSAVLSAEKAASTPKHPTPGGAGRLRASHPSGWHLVVSFEETMASDVREKTGQRIAALWQELMGVLAPSGPY